MRLRRRAIFLFAVLVLMYGSLIHSFVSARTLTYLWNGPSDESLGIQTFAVPSVHQRHQNVIKVLFPDDMREGQRYPVLYILPVNPGLWDDLWINGIREAARHHIANQYQVICVYPRYERMPWYGDHPRNPFIAQERHLIQAVIPFVDRQFPTIPAAGGRYLIGFSKSGWGAYSLLLRHPDLFAKAVSFDAPLLFDDIYQWGSGLREVFGTDENFRGYALPGLLLKRRAQLVGQSPRLVLMGYALVEDHTRDMHALLDQWGIPHQYDLRKWPRHTWESGWFPEAVRLLMKEE